MLTDSHLHMGEIDKDCCYSDLGELGLIFSCTAEPKEWVPVADSRVKPFYGLHPWYADQWDAEVKEQLMSILKENPHAGIGEIGLDDSRGDLESQKWAFADQMEIAGKEGRTVTVHMVGCDKETLDTIGAYGNGTPVILHAFKSESYLKPFSELNCYFSIGPRLLMKRENKVRMIIEKIPDDRLLIETDAPHFPKSFTGMGDLVSRIAELKSISTEELQNLVENNLRGLF